MSPADSLRLLLLSSLWGLSFIFMRVAVPEFGPVPLILVRMGVGALLLIPLLLSLRYLRLVWQNKGACCCWAWSIMCCPSRCWPWPPPGWRRASPP